MTAFIGTRNRHTSIEPGGEEEQAEDERGENDKGEKQQTGLPGVRIWHDKREVT